MARSQVAASTSTGAPAEPTAPARAPGYAPEAAERSREE